MKQDRHGVVTSYIDSSYSLEGELTLLGDTTVGGTIKVQCFDFGDNAFATFVTIQAIPVTSIVQAGPRAGHVQHRHLLPNGPGG